MNPARHFIFDLDGTLVDSLPGIQWSAEVALAQCGIAWPRRDLKPLIGPPIRWILAELSGVHETSALDRLEAAFRSSYDSAGWRMTVAYPGVAPLLQDLDAFGATLWLVTNKPAGATGRILAYLALDGFFDEILCRDSRVPAFPSKAEMLCDLLDRRRLDPHECLMVGDTLEDARAAAAAGIDCALVPHGYGVNLNGPLPDNCRLIPAFGSACLSLPLASEPRSDARLSTITGPPLPPLVGSHRTVRRIAHDRS